MKKYVSLIVIVVGGIFLSLSTFHFQKSYDDVVSGKSIIEENVDLEKHDEEKESESETVENSEKKEEVKKEIVSTSKVEESKENVKQEEKVQSEEKSSTKSNSQEVPKENEEVKESTPKEESKKEKGICSDDNVGWKNWLNNYKKENPYSLVKNTYQEVIDYGENASNQFGYGYWYNSVPITYNAEDCTRQIYMVMLYVPKGYCDDENGNENPQMYIPTTEKLVDVITYLKNKGYNCGNKKWR